MKTDTDIAKLEQLFRAISVKNPKESALKKLREYPERNHCVQFLIAKLRVCHQMALKDESWDVKLEKGCIHGCRILGEMKAEASIDILVRMLNCVKDSDELDIHQVTSMALANIGPPSLETVFVMYEMDQHDPDRASVWLDILSQIGVRDPRIATALHRAFPHDTVLTLIFIGAYGDPEFLPLVERYVQSAARHLNECQIDPRTPFGRLKDPMVGAYIDSREVLVHLQEDIAYSHPDFDQRVQALDDKLLTTKEPPDIDNLDRPQPLLRPSPKIGRNDPCPCGSGKKYKKCCGQI